MSDTTGFALIAVWVGVGVCELHGLYLAAQEGFGSFIIALIIPPWAVIKGLIGFF